MGRPAVPDLDRIDDFLVPLAWAAGVIAVALVLWRLRVRLARQAARRRSAGHRLIDSLKAYSAWIDWHRSEPLQHRDPESLTIPAALAHVVQIKDAHFPELSPLVVELLQTHRALMQYLWEANILRMSQAGEQRPYYADPRYHQLRDAQDKVLDDLFLRCRELIGEGPDEWHHTRSDFGFSSSGMETSTPAT